MSQKTYEITADGLDRLKQKKALIEQKLNEVRQQDRGGNTSWGGSFEKERLQNELYMLTEQYDLIIEQIANAVVVENANQPKEGIVFGSKALLLINKEEIIYTFLSDAEANPSEGIVSLTSPLGKALKNRKEGEVIELPLPAGKLTITVLELIRS